MTMLNKGLKPVLYDKDKAVSPIIATILLVAITVILASTLYLALGGFFSHVGTSTPTASVSVTNNTVAATPGYSYSVTVGTPSPAVSLSNVEMKITFSNGTIVTTSALSSTAQYVVWLSNTAPPTISMSKPTSGNYYTITVSRSSCNRVVCNGYTCSWG